MEQEIAITPRTSFQNVLTEPDLLGGVYAQENGLERNEGK